MKKESPKASTRIKVTAISDMHGEYPELCGGDLLIVAGDLTAMDRQCEYQYFRDWLDTQNYDCKVFIGGNHDGILEEQTMLMYDEWNDYNYLQDSAMTYRGLKIWGSPWTPVFFNWYFMLPRGEMLKEKWDMIPEDTDILVTHGPPRGILDTRKPEDLPLGCVDLREAVERVKPQVHIFGHIHGGYGECLLKHHDGRNTRCFNVAHMNEDYEALNSPITFEMEVKGEVGTV